MKLLVPLSLGAAVGLAVLGGALWQRRASGAAGVAKPTVSAPAVAPPVPVDTVTVKAEPFEIEVKASGSLLPAEAVELVSELNRRLVKVLADEGATVKKGQVLFQLDASDLRADIDKLEVEARLAKTTLERQEKLLGEGIASQQELDAARARHDAALAERRVLGVTLAKTQVRAPFSGRLGLRRVSEGAWVSPNTVLATLQDISALKLDFTLAERHAGLLAVGAPFRFRVEGHGEPFSGTVIAQESSADRATRSIVVRGRVEKSEGLTPGSFATVEVPLKSHDALLVPSIAVIPAVDGRRVFVVKDGMARSVSVEVGARNAERVEVLSGLSPGDEVVVSNLLRLRDGAKVKVLNQGKR